MELLDIDEIQATAILDMQLRRLAALERQKIIDELAEIEVEIAELQGHPGQARSGSGRSSREELAEIVDKYGDERRTQIIPFDGEVSMEDLIAREDVVVTITRTGYAKRTKTDLYRSQKRGGKGVQRRARCGRTTSSSHFFVMLDARLDPVLHEQGPGLPGEGVRAARGQPDRARASTSPTCWPSSRTSRSPRSSRSRTTRSRRTWCWRPRTAW